jgi:P27 family predicted phage terminase small subunit
MPRAHQPPALKLLKGVGQGRDSGGRKVKATPAFRRIAPTPPSWLSREAKAEWKRVVPELLRLDIVKAEDRAALAAYCETWATFVEATRTVQAEGLTIEAKQGTLAHPAVGIARNTGKELRAWANQFGLTPSAENALQLPEVTDDGDNPFG